MEINVNKGSNIVSLITETKDDHFTLGRIAGKHGCSVWNIDGQRRELQIEFQKIVEVLAK